MKGIKKKLVTILGISLFVGCNIKKEERKSVKNEITNNSNEKISRGLSNDLVNETNFKDNVKFFEFNNQDYKGFKKTILIEDVFYTAAILPKDYYILKNLDQKDSLDLYREKLKKEEVIQLDFQQIEGEDLFKKKNFDYEKCVKYLSFNIKRDFYAITSKGDTIKPKGVFFERNYTLAPYKRVLIFFSFPYEINTEVKLVYNDKLFEKGILKFLLKK
ncbi:hypothetical protein [Tenacibaculum sp.]|uniref:hypothetical protein n=1 Tax=Tenacibaculum sp. TaxID=1906242 RepID=UPI003D0C4B6D